MTLTVAWDNRVPDRRELSHALTELTANLMRCAAGAGRPADVMREIRDLAEGERRYRAANQIGLDSDAVRASTSVHLVEHLTCPGEEPRRVAERHYVYAQDRMVTASLRLAAATMVGPRSWVTRSDDEFYAASKELPEAHSERAAAYNAGR